MRMSVFFILLATASMPALAAQSNDRDRGGDRREARAERSQSTGEENSQRPQRAARAERADSAQGAERRVERSQRVSEARAERSPRGFQATGQPVSRSADHSGRRVWVGSRSGDGASSAAVATRDSSDSVTNWRSRERRSPNPTTTTEPTTSRYNRDGDRSRTNWGDRSRDSSRTTTRSGTTNWRERSRDDHGQRWSNNWRNDNRYDWRSHRSRYSSLYRLGRYYDPFGYGYRRFSIGLTLGSGYYGNNYWLNDPWQYRLPPAYGPYRWVRYYNDALLVNVYSGEVADVIYGFFW